MKTTMKTNFFALALTMMALPTFAQSTDPNFVCKDVFLEKIESLKKTSDKRVKSVKALKTVALVSIGAVPATLLSLGTTPLVGFGMVAGAITSGSALGAGYVWIQDTEDKKLEGYENAFDLQKDMFIPYKRALEAHTIYIESLKNEELQRFNNQITHRQVVEAMTREVNELLLSQSLPALSEEEVIALKREEIIQRYNIEPVAYNTVTVALDYLKDKKRVDEKMEYEEFRKILIANQDKFCEGNEARNFRSALKEIFPKIK